MDPPTQHGELGHMSKLQQMMMFLLKQEINLKELWSDKLFVYFTLSMAFSFLAEYNPTTFIFGKYEVSSTTTTIGMSHRRTFATQIVPLVSRNVRQGQWNGVPIHLYGHRKFIWSAWDNYRVCG